ncbi:MAG: 50S ribosomal protein L35 [Candidatus Omnitrophica bacterium 4484_70.1]|nr:MAG: 50S ribosomal protein L35 [Candidatus Omnitrophica bacterium 4484_70.1]
MPKLKTKKALAKRIKITARGKLLRSKAGRRHLLSGKAKKRKRALKKKTLVAVSDKKMVKRALPYR